MSFELANTTVPYTFHWQTLILDCCYSGGANHGEEDTNTNIICEIFKPPAAHPETNSNICSTNNCGGGPANGFAGNLHALHVLLAACWANEKALESSTNGHFMHSLLNILK